MFYPTSLGIRLKISAMRSLLTGPFAWFALDKLEIPGHGIDLIRVDFPPATDSSPSWGFGKPVHRELAEILSLNHADHTSILQSCLTEFSNGAVWPLHAEMDQPELPWMENEFLSPLDMAALYGILSIHRPERYLEIGSGMSTRIAYQGKKQGAFPMEMISIDPDPRINIAGLCDRVIKSPLEEIDTDTFLDLVTPGTVLFVDGSHRSFPGSDVTLFFLNILPRMPSGTIVHIHDIYLPSDYPPKAWNRYWSEQYLLAAYLLGGAKRIKVLLPCAHLSSLPECQTLIASTLGFEEVDGCSFWLSVI